MTHDQVTDHVRQFIQARFQENGASDEGDFRETLLVRRGFYCGRRFDQDGFSAVWFIEEHEVKIHDPDGAVREVHHLGNCPAGEEQTELGPPVRRAA